MSAAEDTAVRELVRAALEGTDDVRHQCLCVLWDSNSEAAFTCGEALCRSQNVEERAFGVALLAQLGALLPVEERPFYGPSLEALLTLLDREESPLVLAALGKAFADVRSSVSEVHRDERCIAPLAHLRLHPSPDVRSAVAHGLAVFDSPIAERVLIELSTDADEGVRRMAVAGLAVVIDRDTTPLRKALLLAAVRDENAAHRATALRGLAERGDDRARGPILEELSSRSKAAPHELHVDLVAALVTLAMITHDPVAAANALAQAAILADLDHPDNASGARQVTERITAWLRASPWVTPHPGILAALLAHAASGGGDTHSP